MNKKAKGKPKAKAKAQSKKSVLVPEKRYFEPREDNQYVVHMAKLRSIVIGVMSLERISFKELAKRAAVHSNTIRRFLSVEALSPKHPTVFRIMRAVGALLYADDPLAKRRRPKKK